MDAISIRDVTDYDLERSLITSQVVACESDYHWEVTIAPIFLSEEEYR